MSEITGSNETDATEMVRTIVGKTPNISKATVFTGIYLYQSRSMFWGYLYANKLIGAFQIMKYDGTIKFVRILNGEYTEIL